MTATIVPFPNCPNRRGHIAVYTDEGGGGQWAVIHHLASGDDVEVSFWFQFDDAWEAAKRFAEEIGADFNVGWQPSGGVL